MEKPINNGRFDLSDVYRLSLTNQLFNSRLHFSLRKWCGAGDVPSRCLVFQGRLRTAP